jgi:hypothetical protein
MRMARYSNMLTITRFSRTRRYLLTGTTTLAAWFVGIALVTLVGQPTQVVVAVGPLSALLRAAVASDATILDIHPGFSRLRSERKGFVGDLYRNGVWFVWPAVEGGCVAPPAGAPVWVIRPRLMSAM